MRGEQKRRDRNGERKDRNQWRIYKKGRQRKNEWKKDRTYFDGGIIRILSTINSIFPTYKTYKL